MTIAGLPGPRVFKPSKDQTAAAETTLFESTYMKYSPPVN